MALKKLPKDVREKLSTYILISNYKRAVEELVYNALDAGSTSVAIRINIESNSIQVIDNGTGIEKADFALLGQTYATSKCVDLTSLKSAPYKYGFRGLSLASLVEVSEKVKITSRYENTEETWCKIFTNGKQSSLLETTSRPSKGTTVEIKGFLYNLKIRKNAIDSINEINKIKTFLEQLSLVHSLVSVSLRNDSTNEIIFKVHKNRDTYQTLETLFGIDKKTVQEFKVEKNEYKVKAFIAKNSEDTKQYHWIYLNGRVIRNTKLFKIVNDNFAKSLKLNQNLTKSKKKIFEEENVTSKSVIPTYFIFITCPNYDFDISHTPNQKTLEFKNWDNVTKIIEKLIKFYTGDINLKTVKKNVFVNTKNKPSDMDTRDQVKNIIKKILGSGPKKPAVSQMQKCVKGKLIKRKHLINTKENKKLNLSLSKVLPPRCSSRDADELIQTNKDSASNILGFNRSPVSVNLSEGAKNSHGVLKSVVPVLIEGPLIIDHNSEEKRKRTVKPRKEKKKKEKSSKILTKVQKQKHAKLQNHNVNKKRELKLDPLAKKFESTLTESTKKRCDDLANKVEKLMKSKHQPKCEIFVNENVQYSNFVNGNQNISIRKKIDEIVIHNYAPVSPEYDICSFDNRVWGKRNNINEHETIKSYDLLKTVLKLQPKAEDKTLDMTTYDELSMPNEIYSPSYILSSSPNFTVPTNCENFQSLRKLTYESHNYGNFNSKSNTYRNVCTPRTNLQRNKHFITKESRDNFVMPQDTYNFRKMRKHFSFKNKIPFPKPKKYFPTIPTTYDLESSVTIEFSTSKSIIKNKEFKSHFIDFEHLDDNHTYTINKDAEYLFQSSNFGNTYTLFSNLSPTFDVRQVGEAEKFIDPKISEVQDKKYFNEEHQTNVVFVSESQEKQSNDEILENHLENPRGADIKSLVLNSTENEKVGQDMFYEKFSLDSFLCDRNLYTFTQPNRPKNFDSIVNEDVSHHFGIDANMINHENVVSNDDQHKNLASNTITDLQTVSNVKSNFNFKNRLRFVPKGLSPIFENCRTKSVADHKLEIDYFANEIYNNFADEVQANADIFESDMQNVKELYSKAIVKVNDKINKDHAALIFNGDSIKHATVLNQVGGKFIAAKMFSKADESKVSAEHLILFDQHAVDERIRLEKCLEDYIIGNEWKRHILDNAIILKFDPEEIAYLHNYRDKFNQLGLQWSTSDNNIIISSIPKAILGNHSRPVEVVIKAVKYLIVEQINSMKSQNGCLTFYPKSIMELIFSEACRYAIKFGDKLSKDGCVELLTKLAECKTPFQCAHGRPVMAVIVDIKNQKHEYKMKFSRVQQFIKSQKSAKK